MIRRTSFASISRDLAGLDSAVANVSFVACPINVEQLFLLRLRGLERWLRDCGRSLCKCYTYLDRLGHFELVLRPTPTPSPLFILLLFPPPSAFLCVILIPIPPMPLATVQIVPRPLSLTVRAALPSIHFFPIPVTLPPLFPFFALSRPFRKRSEHRHRRRRGIEAALMPCWIPSRRSLGTIGEAAEARGDGHLDRWLDSCRSETDVNVMRESGTGSLNVMCAVNYHPCNSSDSLRAIETRL